MPGTPLWPSDVPRSRVGRAASGRVRHQIRNPPVAAVQPETLDEDEVSTTVVRAAAVCFDVFGKISTTAELEARMTALEANLRITPVRPRPTLSGTLLTTPAAETA